MWRLLILLSAAIGLQSPVAGADAKVYQVGEPTKVILKQGWAAEKVVVDGAKELLDDGSVDADPSIKSQFDFDAVSSTLKCKAPGQFFVTLRETVKKEADDLFVKVAAVGPKTPVPTKTSGAMTGGDTNAAKLRGDLGVTSNDFEMMVLQMAKTWAATGKGREDFVFRYDYTPLQTCREISGILRDTADLIQKQGNSVKQADDAMMNRFKQFYAAGQSPYRTKNPRIEDWQPFLQELEKKVYAKLDADYGDRESDKFKQGTQLALRELADGFDDLASEISGSGPTGGGADGGGSVTTGGGAGAAGSGCPHCRRRHRCRCSRLLLGF